MRLHWKLVPVAALTLALGAAALPAEAGQGERGESRRRGSVGQARERGEGTRAPRDGGGATRRTPNDAARDGRDDSRGRQQLERRDNRRDESRVERRSDRRDERRDNGGRSWNERNDRRDDRRDTQGRSWNDRNDRRYVAPRIIVPRRVAPRRVAPRRYYGPNGHMSVYFGWGSGYRYGAPYSGRVYGYAAPSRVYGSRRYFGDVRLLVRPRHAEVYVDGYYAGIVDNFDGIFQRLTLESGPHQIEIAAPGFEPQVFDVYVDPTRTVDLHGDLYPDRP
jgi:hypothetical protein